MSFFRKCCQKQLKNPWVCIKTITIDRATLPIQFIAEFEAPVKTVKCPKDRMKDLIGVIQSVTHTSHPTIIEPIDVHYHSMIQTNKSFELKTIGL